MENLGILEEENKGQEDRFYIYDFESNEALHWFNSYDEANQYLEYLKGKV
jgi:hypothetical protein